MPIQLLSEQVVAQIAAGEVIERPASVIKELIENSLDAGADNIHISVKDGGRQLLQVSDNGCGIPAVEVDLAFQRHATSKLITAHDLNNIETLGFRGEALASIASVSRVTLTSRSSDDTAGAKVRIEGGRIEYRESVGAPAGTVVRVENLFFNTPARLKFMKAENTEKRQIALVVSRYALAYPHVRFVLEQDGREALRTTGSNQLDDVIITTLGLSTFRDMFDFNNASHGNVRVHLHGYASRPSLSRSDRSRIILFVNGRWIQDSSLTYAVVQAYHTFLMKGRFPIAVVMIDVPVDEVDVNVHPTKAEVRFQKPNEIFSAVQRTIRRSLLDSTQTAHISNGSTLSRNMTDFSNRPTMQMGLELSLDSPGWYPHQYADTKTTDPTAIPHGPEAPNQPRTLPLLRVVGQIGASYIVAEGPAGLYLIDQHAAHERILYEQFMDDYANKEPVAQYTLASQTIELPTPEARLIDDNLQVLRDVGFDMEPFGTNTFVIRSVPALLTDSDPMEAVYGIIEELEHGDTPGHASIEEKIIQRVCKQGAVKAGTILSLEEMQGLIRQLERAESPHTCPHGRPTMLHMTSDQLAREFGRK